MSNTGGFVSIIIEVHNSKGERTNVIKDSWLTEEFMRIHEHDLYGSINRMVDQTAKEITNPSVPKEMG